MSRKKVLVIADVEHRDVPLPLAFDRHRFQVTEATDPVSGVAQAAAEVPDVVVLALKNGSPRRMLQVCQQILDYLPEEKHPTFIVRGASANGDAIPLVTDNIATVESATATANDDDSEPRSVTCHGIHLDRVRLRVRVEDRPVALTLSEFHILWSMISAPGHVRDRRQLIAACGGSMPGNGRRTVDQHIRSIRQKLGDRGELVETVRGVGYRFRDCPSCSESTSQL